MAEIPEREVDAVMNDVQRDWQYGCVLAGLGRESERLRLAALARDHAEARKRAKTLQEDLDKMIVAGWLALFMPYETKPTVTLRRVLEARIADVLRAERERADALLERIEALTRLRSEVWTAHVPVTDTQHDPARGLIHGCCERCRMPWPCDYSPERALTSFAPRGFGADPPAGREDELGKTAAEIVGTSSAPEEG